jgi:copper chaperone CopZ
MKFIPFLLLLSLILFHSVWAETSSQIDPAPFEMEVMGMTCPFCVYSIEKNLNKLPGVSKAQVSMKQKKVRIVMDKGLAVDEAKVREVITNAGFTPGERVPVE